MRWDVHNHAVPREAIERTLRRITLELVRGGARGASLEQVSREGAVLWTLRERH